MGFFDIFKRANKDSLKEATSLSKNKKKIIRVENLSKVGAKFFYISNPKTIAKFEILKQYKLGKSFWG
jgi:hypothetical protein